MLSTRGEAYAQAGLADGYLGPRKAPFDKDTKRGVVSFGNAENVSQTQQLPCQVPKLWNVHVLSHSVVVSDARCHA
jgi:hypothetical protein